MVGRVGQRAGERGGGGSIPLVNALQAAAPEAEILLVGATDGYANIHAPDERVMLDELEKSVVAEADFFARFAARWSALSGGRAAGRPRPRHTSAPARRHRAPRQQDARPGDPVPRGCASA